jgi:phage terminase large subunit-like protein
VLRMAGAGGPGDGLRVDLLRARQGKHDRALPVSAAYARGQVRHAGVFRELEDEMCAFGVEGERPSRSPDRMDALVWAVQALINRPAVQPRVVGI